jgi:hypothetical protein
MPSSAWATNGSYSSIPFVTNGTVKSFTLGHISTSGAAHAMGNEHSRVDVDCEVLEQLQALVEHLICGVVSSRACECASEIRTGICQDLDERAPARGPLVLQVELRAGAGQQRGPEARERARHDSVVTGQAYMGRRKRVEVGCLHGVEEAALVKDPGEREPEGKYGGAEEDAPDHVAREEPTKRVARDGELGDRAPGFSECIHFIHDLRGGQ